MIDSHANKRFGAQRALHRSGSATRLLTFRVAFALRSNSSRTALKTHEKPDSERIT